MSQIEEVKFHNINSPEPIQGDSFRLDIVYIDGRKYISYEQFKEYQDWKCKHEQH